MIFVPILGEFTSCHELELRKYGCLCLHRNYVGPDIAPSLAQLLFAISVRLFSVAHIRLLLDYNCHYRTLASCSSVFSIIFGRFHAIIISFVPALRCFSSTIVKKVVCLLSVTFNLKVDEFVRNKKQKKRMLEASLNRTNVSRI